MSRPVCRLSRVLSPLAACALAFPPSLAGLPIAASAEPAAGTLWIDRFESADETAARWNTQQASIRVVDSRASEGRSAAAVTFKPAQVSSVAVAGKQLPASDWSAFAHLSFDITNAQPLQERVIVQLTDRQGKRYKEDIYLSADSGLTVRLDLGQVAAFVDLSQVKELEFFRWQAANESVFYLDAVALLPALRGEAALPAAASAESVVPGKDWQVRWTHALAKVFRDPKALESQPAPVRFAMARNEYESAQLLLIGGAQAARVRVSIGTLVHENGKASLPTDTIEIRRVDYVRTVKPYYPAAHVGEWPDPLPLAEYIDVAAGAVQPVWITLGVPDSSLPGRYAGEIELLDSFGRAETVPIEATVWDFSLPQQPHLATAFGFYRNRLEQAYAQFVPGGESWEARLDELEHRYALDMLKHRLWPILDLDPFSTRFRESVPLYQSLGLGRAAIGIHGGNQDNDWPKDAAELEQLMQWYAQAADMLHDQGMLDGAYVYAYDEPKPGDPHVAQVLGALHRAAPELKTLLVMHQAPDPARDAEWMKDADILAVRLANLDPRHAPEFRKLGKELWMYVSSPSHPFPSLVIDTPAVAARILPWMCWKYGITGILYWCVNYWAKDPWATPATFADDQNGNGFLYYPAYYGPVPSIRLEALRDGLEDYEYLWLLGERLKEAKASGAADAALIERAERLLAVDPNLVESFRSYAGDPAVLQEQRGAVAAAILDLQGAVQAAAHPAGEGLSTD